MTGFEITRIPEPKLVFADGEEKKDPRAGLLEHGPCPISEKVDIEVVNVGIVGSSRSISRMEGLLRGMRSGIRSNENRKRWKQNFPGFDSKTDIGIDYQTLEKWKGRIRPKDVQQIEELPSREDRVDFALKLFNSHIQRICSQTPKPDVVFVPVPQRIVDCCSDPSMDTQRIRTETTNFHSQIKISGMKNRTPTQLLLPRTLYQEGEDVQEESELAWNLAVGMLYKAREGRPWKLAKLRSKTCYAGISFYKERGEDGKTRAALAQVFIEDGRNFVIEGGEVEDISGDDRPGETHLSREDAKRLAEDILEQYGQYRDVYPDRFVLHKSSNFLDEEAQGFSDGTADVPEKEFAAVRERHPFRLFPGTGDNPAVRGTLAIPPGRRECYLYTQGYVPEQSVYNGPGTPNPIVICPHEEYFSQDYRRFCQEILSFTKLDWNSSDFCKRLPVTLGIAQKVGGILAEPEASDVNLDTHYYYYM